MNKDSIEKKRRLRQEAFERIRKEYPYQSPRWCRFQAKTLVDGEMKRLKEGLIATD